MAGCAYHSPQFSEDAAWLPPWLQPNQLPAFGDHHKGEHTVSPLAWKNLFCSAENKCERHDDHLCSGEDAVSSGWRLFFSGEDNSTGENTTSGNAPSLHLHLSSFTGSLFSDEVDEMTQIGNKSMPWKPISAIPTVYKNKICSNKVEDCAPESKISPLDCSRRQGKNTSSKPVSNAEQTRERFRKKVDFGNLKNKGIRDAVELSIAASEALVISEMANGSLQSEPFPAAEAILEVALRVKQARKECRLDVAETVPDLLTDALDETSQLSDLDDDIMKSAFDDVGLSFNQINVTTPENSSPNEKFYNSEKLLLLSIPSSPPNASFLEGPGNQKVKSQSMVVPEARDNISETSTQGCDASAIKKPDALPANQIVSRENGRISEVTKGTALGGLNTRRSVKAFFIQETSFISESMDAFDKYSSEARSDAGHEVVASSSAPFCSVTEHDKNIHEQLVLSQELVRSSSSSLVDPLCSVVPCSLPLEDVTHDINEKGTNKNLENLTSSVPLIPSPDLSRKCTIPDSKVEGHDIFRINTEGSAMPSRRKLNSLKPYSMVMPDPDKVGEIVPTKVISPESKKEKPINFFSTVKDTSCMFKGTSSSVPSSPLGECVAEDGPQHNHNFGNKCHEQVEGPSTVYRHRGLQACTTFLISGKVDDGGVKRSPTPKMRKFISKCSTKEVHSMDETTNALQIPPQSIMRSHPVDKQSLPTKRVHFLEANLSTCMAEVCGEPQPLKGVSGSNSRKRKRVKGPCLQYKSGTGNDNCKYSRKYHARNAKELIFLGLEFLLTGFSAQAERKLENVIREFGGYVLSSIPSCPKYVRRKQGLECSAWKLPIVLSPKKVKSTKFLYGCAINTWMLNADWILDSVEAGFLLSPQKYMNRAIQSSKRHQLQVGEPLCFENQSIFDKLGVMLYGKARFCIKFSKIIKYGGGLVYKSLQQLVQSIKNGKNSIGFILVEDDNCVSRHLKQCILEQNLPLMTANWIINSLFSGKLLPFKKNRYAFLHQIKMPTFPQDQAMDMSQEI
ncbi:hypothetical protein J5N97_017908 [Dioscorea zingiberensis]|uniref:BRCT domain-containing protein n=1 Tax=Dioscorea zingiberensis TaxID=325984 RepID=A0A9D5CLZ2_9LILI|nr:hypothetical protein J5N97_017908 [Dioscorea zingiberensis]